MFVWCTSATRVQHECDFDTRVWHESDTTSSIWRASHERIILWEKTFRGACDDDWHSPLGHRLSTLPFWPPRRAPQHAERFLELNSSCRSGPRLDAWTYSVLGENSGDVIRDPVVSIRLEPHVRPRGGINHNGQSGQRLAETERDKLQCLRSVAQPFHTLWEGDQFHTSIS